MFSSFTTQEIAAAAICNLAVNEQNRTEISKEGAIPKLIQVMPHAYFASLPGDENTRRPNIHTVMHIYSVVINVSLNTVIQIGENLGGYYCFSLLIFVTKFYKLLFRL